jgi:hypothetical protein
MAAKLYIQIASCWPWPKLSRRTNRILRIATHPLHADCGLGTRGLGPIIAAPYLHFAQLQSKSTSEKEKHGEKHSFSDGKCFTDFVLPRCFIEFQTTLVDSRNLVIFSTFW